MSVAPSTPRNQANTKKMHDNNQHAVVRDLASTGLEGAFRVHLTPDNLDQAHLKVGDVCEISCDDGTTGFGIAWRAEDRANSARPRTRPVKMTETIKTAFGFQDGSKVTISATDSRILPADRVTLSDVTPPEYTTAGEADAAAWEVRIKNLFLNCEALAPGISFDVPGKKKSRKRFYIENIESSTSATDSPCLFSSSGSTEIILPEDFMATNIPTRNEGATPNGVSSANGTTSNGASANPHMQLNTDGIGGLLEQCQELNLQLRRLVHRSKAILLHGYEGTGKTTLLESLTKAFPHENVLHLNRSTLTGGTVSKNQNIIKASFQQAAEKRPSLLVMDDLEQLAPTDDVVYARTIAEQLKHLHTQHDRRVLVVAATRSPSNVHPSLDGYRLFNDDIELSVPDIAAREQILNVLLGKPVFAKYTLSSTIAERTHGFTAKDIAKLYGVAESRAELRYEQECAELEMGRSPTPPAYNDIVPQVDGASSSAQPTAAVTLADFEFALRKVKPTALREIFTERPKMKWSDIGGSNNVKKIFDHVIGWPLHHKDKMIKRGIETAKGALLYGPPGCSKTLTAQAVANTYNLNFIAIKGAELISMYVGESERAVRDVFNKAKQAAPCVIFFDEIDAIGSDRDSAGTKGLNVLTTLLNEMDGFETLKDVFVLAATNKPWDLDAALMRPGRFDSHVYLGPPSADARKEIISMSTRTLDLTGVDFDSLGRDTDGYSGAEIVRMCNVVKELAFERELEQGGEFRATGEDFAAARIPKGITPEMIEAYEAFSKREA